MAEQERPAVDLWRVREKISYLRRHVHLVQQSLTAYERERASSDPSVPPDALMLAVEHALQTAIQAIIDMSYHITSKVLRRAPVDAYDALSGLEEVGAVSADTVSKCRGMIGFRNRLVHAYEDIDASLVVASAGRTDDFERFAREIEGYLEEHFGSG